jgi:hypothetical protein
MNTLIKDSRASSLDDLRGMMREKFPEAHASQDTYRVLQKGNVYRTGVPCLDEAGIVEGTVTEVASTGLSNGSAVLLASLILKARAQRRFIALVDGMDSFDPQGLGPDACDLLLWLRCRTLDEAVKVTDLLLRDGNVRLVLCDLVLNSAKELRQVPNNVWYRLRNLAEESGVAFIVFTPMSLITCAHLRLVLDKTLTMSAFDQTLEEIEQDLKPRIEKGRNVQLPERSIKAS